MTEEEFFDKLASIPGLAAGCEEFTTWARSLPGEDETKMFASMAARDILDTLSKMHMAYCVITKQPKTHESQVKFMDLTLVFIVQSYRSALKIVGDNAKKQEESDEKH